MVDRSGRVSIDYPRHTVKVVGNRRAFVVVGTPRFRLQYFYADKRFGSEYAVAVSISATRKTILRWSHQFRTRGMKRMNTRTSGPLYGPQKMLRA